mgnify:CR=1 FL=1|jgi:UDP-N-acetyl-D-galactosamine dehydrogenase
MSLYEKLINREESMSVIGLGYVGMPIAVSFANKGINVIGYDINAEKINLYKSGVDPTNEVGGEAISNTTVKFTTAEKDIQCAKFHIIAVPTPINLDKTPNLIPVESASVTVGRNLRVGSVVVYESTVYPGVTEDVCIPILEKSSGLKCGIDFKVGYSPERINPGDKVNTLDKIVKIVSGMDSESLEEIAKVYELIIKAGVHKAGSIKVAEAAKVVENSQRDINIAFMNELAMVFDRIGIDTNEVIEAMNTKWNALRFTPGLVGGHCISVDPYYFIYEAEKLGYHSQIILSGRRINDGMGEFVADAAIKKMIQVGKAPAKSKVIVFGITFKENCSDIRNSKVIDVYNRLKEYGIFPVVIDPWASKKEAQCEYNIELKSINEAQDADCIIFAVAHKEFKLLSLEHVNNMYKDIPVEEKVLVDVKGIFNIKDVMNFGFSFWRL